jgi:hypothetical protein
VDSRPGFRGPSGTPGYLHAHTRWKRRKQQPYVRGSTGRPCGCGSDWIRQSRRGNHSRDRKPAVRGRCHQETGRHRLNFRDTATLSRAAGARHLLHLALSWERLPWRVGNPKDTRASPGLVRASQGRPGNRPRCVVYLIWVTTSSSVSEFFRLLRSLRAWLSSRSWTRCGSVRRALSAASACPARWLASGLSATCGPVAVTEVAHEQPVGLA